MHKHYRTIIISDLHLGTASSKVEEIVKFLLKNTCDHLIMNGDMIDAWELRKSGKWKARHTRFVKVIMRMMEMYNTRVTYLRGNHDEFLEEFMPLQVGNLFIQQDCILESKDKRLFVVHGDIFDNVTTHMKWIAKLGSAGYNLLLWLNKFYNQYRRWRGKEPYSFSQYIKGKVKSAVNKISAYEKQLTEFARTKQCDGIVCGHIHKPAMKEMEGGLLYMNSGDWVESMTALVEDYDGNWELIYYKDWLLSLLENEHTTLEQENEQLDKNIKIEPEYLTIAQALPYKK
ncbi:MAG: UDP-2,3-diacylglucosamine diphosphatase [Microscillaceae bacterium]|nr:UDP-2,3-diacylglucosamine diphosphatase [Microscillaceae bacterium]MDW8459827.1 UDP-2,3-diacylglucosamine diphosphatase [Cytophagales bacterium]